MLVVLSGVQTINIKLLAELVTCTMNTFKVDDYIIDFKSLPYKVYDANKQFVCNVQGRYATSPLNKSHINKIVLEKKISTGNDVNGIKVLKTPDELPSEDPNYHEDRGENTPVSGTDNIPVGELFNEDFGLVPPPPDVIAPEIIERIHALHNEISHGVFLNHFRNVFTTCWDDFGLHIDPEFEDKFETEPGFKNPHSYQDVLDNYKNRVRPVHVISGFFGKRFLNKIRQDLGADNVVVINLTRNPSIAYLLNDRPDSFYSSPDLNYKSLDLWNLQRSILNAVAIKKEPYVTTIKFEDMLVDQQFSVRGAVIKLPEAYKEHNRWVTKFEQNSYHNDGYNLDAFNYFNNLTEYYRICRPYHANDSQVLGDDNNPNNPHTGPIVYKFFIDHIDEMNSTLNLNLVPTDFDKIPSNLFVELGYAPLPAAALTSR